MYCCHCFLISSASVRSIPFLSFIVPIFAWNGPLAISNLLEEISSLSHSVVFLYFFALITEEAVLSLLAIPWNSPFKWVSLSFSPLPLASLIFSTICKASSDNHFAFFHFFFLGMVLITASCTMPRTSIHSSSGTLSDIISWICYCPCIIVRDLIEAIPEWSTGFPYFLHLSLNLAIRSSWSEPQSAPSLISADCIELLHLWLQRI